MILKVCGVTLVLLGVLAIMIANQERPACEEGPCGKGHYKKQINDGADPCVPCPLRTFMPLENHRCIECFYCTKAEEILREKVHEECTSVADTSIICIDGYFREKGRCTRCRSCGPGETEVQKCERFTDTECELSKDTPSPEQPTTPQESATISPEQSTTSQTSNTILPDQSTTSQTSTTISPEQSRTPQPSTTITTSSSEKRNNRGESGEHDHDDAAFSVKGVISFVMALFTPLFLTFVAAPCWRDWLARLFRRNE